MKYYSVLLWALMLSVGIVACSDDDATVDPAPVVCGSQGIIPLSVGNTWTYKIDNYYNLQLETTNTSVVKIFRSRMDSVGQTWYSPSMEDTTFTVWWCNSSEGYEIYSSTTGTFVYKYPAVRGDQYAINTKQAKYNIVVVCVDTLVTVPAGTFSCYRYDLYNGSGFHFSTQFYSPDAGAIKSAEWFPDSTILTTSELLNYHLE